MNKRLHRLFSLLLVLALLGSAVLPVFAAEEMGFTGTVGKKEQFQFYQDYEDLISSAKLTEGSVPGMELNTVNNNTAELTGTPTQAGTFTVKADIETENSGTVSYVLTVTIAEAESKSELKVTKHPTDEKVAEGSSVTFISRADGNDSFSWEFTTKDGGVVACKELPDLYPGVEVTGYNDEKLVLNKVPMEFDGCKVRCKFSRGDESVFSNYAAITVKTAEDLAPTITKHPTGESVSGGGRAVFIAKADNTDSYEWQMLDTDGKHITWTDAKKEFPDLKFEGETTERIVLTQIPEELDGFKFQCVFKGPGGESTSKAATLEVTPEDGLPQITKHPTGETVTEGAAAAFIAKAKYVTEFTWQLVSPDGGTVLTKDNVKEEFPDLKMGGYDTERLSLENIPLEFSGWKVRCKFEGEGGDVTSEEAIVTVNPDPDKPTEETTEATEATSEATEATTEATEATEEKNTGATEENKKPINTIGASPNKGASLKNILLVILIVLGAAVFGAGAAALVVLLRQRRR